MRYRTQSTGRKAASFFWSFGNDPSAAPDHPMRAALHFVVDAADILADDPEAHHLDSPKEEDQYHDGGKALHGWKTVPRKEIAEYLRREDPENPRKRYQGDP